MMLVVVEPVLLRLWVVVTSNSSGCFWFLVAAVRDVLG
jgi:hypothetical protein